MPVRADGANSCPAIVELIRKNAKDRPEGSRKVIDSLILALPKDEKK